ncbi:hypothetical protein BH11PLA2_BH11PLA2_07000 [soil metagenome]
MSVTYIVGAGGIGCAVGYAMLQTPGPLVFVEVDKAKLQYGQLNGIQVDNRKPLAAEFVHFDDWQPQPGDRVYLTTKCYDNAAVLAKLPEDVDLIPIQNGYDTQLEDNGHPTEGIASFVARCVPHTTRTHITRPGQLHFGGRGNSWGVLQDYSSWSISNLFEVIDVHDIRPIKATKLMYNAAISPIAAAAGLDNGALLSEPKAQKLFFDLIQENYRILTAANIPLGKVGPFHPRTVSKILQQRWLAKLMAKKFERSLRGTYCSMAGEIEQGRTELDNYTGHLLRLAGDTISAPINRRVYEVVSRMTRERIPPHRGVIDELSS